MVLQPTRPTCPNTQDGTIPNRSTTQSTVPTLSTSDTAARVPSSGCNSAAPTPGHSYIIKIKNTDLAIVLVRGELRLQGTKLADRAGSRWLCCEKGIFLGFYNEESRVYLGHDGNGNMGATAQAFQDWERLVARAHREGGYELLSPHWAFMKRIICAADNRTRLVRKEHGHTFWVFEECEG